jgi:hypothetical protein
LDKRLVISFLVLLIITSSITVPATLAQKASTDEQDEINGPGGLMSLTGLPSHTTNSSLGDPLKIKEHHPVHVKKFIGSFITLSGGESPATVWTSYGFSGLSCTHTTTTDWADPSLCGHGQTIAIVDAFDDPNIASDLQTFDTQFGLPACTTSNGCFVKSAPSGITTDSGWALEISLDVEWAHSIAPGAKIILVESSDNTLGSLLGGESTAVGTGAQQVSDSWGGNEFSSEGAYDSYFNSPTASFFVASGDGGHGVEWPSASPYVISVGGTTLNVDSSGHWVSEAAWSGSGGGLSAYESKPSYQNCFHSGNQRAVPDVAYDGDPNTGVYVYDSVPINGQSGWWIVGGTSAGTPQWAGLSAIANSLGTKLASASFGTSTALYGAATGAESSPQTNPYLSNYHDITSGSNGNCGSLCNAGLGYDEVTGLGSPQANNLIPYLLPPANPTSPSAPQNLAAKGGNGQVSLTWNPPVSNGGSTIICYDVYRGTISGGEGATPIATVGGSTTSYTNSGLTNVQTYYYTVTALNVVGQSPPSNEASAKPTTTGDTTSTVVKPNPSSQALLSTKTYHVTVTDTSSSPTTPTGTVSWSEGSAAGHFSSSSCTLASASSSASTCSIVYTAPSSTGSVTLTATYSGDVKHSISSGTSAVTITLRQTSTAVTPNPSSVVHGNPITYIATLTDTSGGTKSAPTGTVSWTASVSGGNFNSGTCALVATSSSQSKCSVTYAPLAAGSLTITAKYLGDSTHKTSSGKSALTVT